jgi:hypothetical protein
MPGIPTTLLDSEIKALVAEVHGFRTEFAEFRGKTETQMGFARWAGIFVASMAASTLIAVLGFGVKLVWDASKLDSRIAYQAERLDRIEKMQERTAVSIEALVKAMAAKTMAGVERPKPGN